MKKMLSLLLVFGLLFSTTITVQADSGFEFKSYLYDLEYPPRILVDTRTSQLAATAASGSFGFGLEVSEAFTLDQLIVFSASPSSASLAIHLTQIVDAAGVIIAEDQQNRISWSTEAALFEEEPCFQLSAPVQSLDQGVYYVVLEGTELYLNEFWQPVLLITDRPAEATGLTLSYLDAVAVEILMAPPSQPEEPGEDEAEAYSRGFIDGYNRGYEERYDEGGQVGFEQGYADAADKVEPAQPAELWGKIEQLPDHVVAGTDAEQGYEEGYALGSQRGYEDGCADGYQQGYTAYSEQEQDGQDGQQEQDGVVLGEENPPYALPENTIDPALVLFIDGMELDPPLASTIQDGRTLVAMQPLLEKLGFAFLIEEETQRIDIMSSDQEALLLSLDLDSPMVRVYAAPDEEGQEMILDVPARFIAGSYMIPLRFVAETLGFEVVWNEADRSVSILSMLSIQG